MAAKTLAGSKPTLEKDLKKLLEDAAYEAWMTGVQDSDSASISAMVKKNMDAASRKFAKKFAETACGPMADAIYNFVKEIGIMLTPSGALIAPQAMSGALPVTGTCPITDFTIQ